MKRVCAVAALAAALITGFCAAAWAQEVVLDPSDYHICNALPSNRGMDLCVEYYQRKEAIMSDVLKTFYESMYHDPGNEAVPREVLLRITEWQDHLDELYEALDAELPAGDWTEELHAAFHNEVTSTDTAAQFWSNECMIATMTNQEIVDLEDADQDYREKVLELHTMAYDMAQAYQNAQRALAGGLSREERNRLCVDFAPNVAKAVTISYVLEQMYDQMVDTFMESTEVRDSYRALFDQDTDKYLAGLPAEWELDEQAEIHMIEMFDDHLQAALLIKGYVDELNADTIFDNVGQPFDRIDYAGLPDEFKRALDAICQ